MDIKEDRQANYQKKSHADHKINQKAKEAYDHQVDKLSKKKYYGVEPHSEEAIKKYEDTKQLDKLHQIKNNPNAVYKSHKEQHEMHDHVQHQQHK